MRFRWKLLVLFLCLSIIPIVLLRTFGIYNVRRTSDELTRQIRKNQADQSALMLQESIRHYAPLFNRIVAQLEMALIFQAHEARGLIEEAAALGPPEPRAPGGHPGGGPKELWWWTVQKDHVVAGAGPACRASAASLEIRLADLGDTYRVIADYLGSLVLRQTTRLPCGSVTCFPCGTAEAVGLVTEGAERLQTASREKMSFWSRPYQDPATGRSVVSLTLPIGPEDGEPLGSTSMILSLDELLHAVAVEEKLPESYAAFIATLSVHPATGQTGIEVLAHRGSPMPGIWKNGFVDPSVWPDPPAYRAVVADFTRQRSSVSSLVAGDTEAYWVYNPIPHQGTGLIVVIPKTAPHASVESMTASIQARTSQVAVYTLAFLGFLALAGSAAALMFSRAITRPLEAITRAAKALAAGDLQARANVSSRDEIGVLAASINEIGPKLEQAYQTRRSIEIASEIQKRLLPDPPDLDDYDVFGLTLYSGLAGGDYYDYLCQQPRQRRLCVAIGDVSGHGLASALLMASVRSAIRMRSFTPGSIGEIVAGVNDVFAEDVGQSGNFMTLLLVRLDGSARRLEWVRAGHDPGILYDPSTDAFRILDGRGIPLGVEKGVTFEEQSAPIAQGEILFLGTDGIWETRNDAGEVFGKERVYGLIREHAAGSARDIALAVISAVEAFRGSEKEDDITCLVVKIKK